MSFYTLNAFACSIESSNEFLNEELTTYTPYLITYHEDTGNFIYSDPWLDLEKSTNNNLSNEQSQVFEIEDSNKDNELLPTNFVVEEEIVSSTHIEQRETVERFDDHKHQEEQEVSDQAPISKTNKQKILTFYVKFE
jgi:hypothetical protein